VVGILRAVDGFHAVERNGELRAFGDDLVGVPLAASLDRDRALGEGDDRASTKCRIRALSKMLTS
jgi:hypothetical protein